MRLAAAPVPVIYGPVAFSGADPLTAVRRRGKTRFQRPRVRLAPRGSSRRDLIFKERSNTMNPSPDHPVLFSRDLADKFARPLKRVALFFRRVGKSHGECLERMALRAPIRIRVSRPGPKAVTEEQNNDDAQNADASSQQTMRACSRAPKKRSLDLRCLHTTTVASDRANYGAAANQRPVSLALFLAICAGVPSATT
jgi:hypothetical protein